MTKSFIRLLLFAILLLNVAESLGQNKLEGHVLSVADNTPISFLYYNVDNKPWGRTDSLGFFSISTTKTKITLSFLLNVLPIDTILYITKNSRNIILYSAKAFDSALAQYDIKKGLIRLFCGVSMAPTMMTQLDKKFENKYRTSYHIVGDFLYSSVKQMASYNLVVAKFLDKKFGTIWRQEMRTDVLGISQRVGS